MYSRKDVYSSEQKKPVYLFVSFLSSLCCINVKWVCITRSYHYDGLSFVDVFFFVFHEALLKTKCSKFIKRQNKTEKAK